MFLMKTELTFVMKFIRAKIFMMEFHTKCFLKK